MGEIVVLLLIVSAAALFSSLGLDASSTKFVASFKATGDNKNMQRAGYGCLIINSMVTTLVSVAIYYFSNPLALTLLGSASKAPLLRLLIIEIAAVSVNGSLSGILTGLKLFKELSLTSVLTFALRQFLVVVFLSFGWGVQGIVIGWGIGDSLNALLRMFYVRKFLGAFRSGFNPIKLVRFSAPLLLGEAVTYVWTWFDAALLIPLVSLAQLGSYNVALTAFTMLDSLPSSISGTLFPFYSHFYPREGETSHTMDLEYAVKTASRYISYFTVPLSVGMAVTGMAAATLLAGSGYSDAVLPLVVLSISLALSCQGKALGQIFTVLGKTVVSALVSMASVLIAVLLGILMITHFGIVGASMARGMSFMLSLILSMVVLRKYLKLRFDKGAFHYAWVASLIMAAVVLLLEAVLYSRYLLPVYVVLGGIVYVLALRFLHAANSEDVELISEFLGPKLKFLTGTLRTLLGVRQDADTLTS